MSKVFKTIVLGILVLVVGLNANSVHALENEGTPVQLPADIEDGVMSNPDGYEQVKARGAGYNMTWTVENGQKVMYDGVGNRFGEGECKKVIDVSTYNGAINWPAVQNGGVDGAILRATSYATGYIGQDPRFSQNVNGCKSVQMPFGVYLYSYSTNAQEALYEANYLIGILQNNGVAPSDLTYPVYLDLEGNNYTNGISVSTYEQIVSTFVGTMEAAGYKTHVYSYKSYLVNNLNSAYIHQYVSWVAQYGLQLTFTNQYYSGMNGWQYQSNGSVPGVSGEVDVNCFTGLYSGVVYQTHVQDVGWQTAKGDGMASGTSGKSKRMEAISIALVNRKFTGDIQYQTHVQDIGWQDWMNGGSIAGTNGQSKRLEAIRIRLTGEMANNYDVYYQVHAQEYGWMGWAKNGESAGTEGYEFRLESIKVVLVAKGVGAPGNTNGAYARSNVAYQTHVQDVGWQIAAHDGIVAGTTGQSKRLEAIGIGLTNPLYSGSIQYQTHIQDIGWQGWREQGQMSGTSAQSKRLEAIQITLTGEMANKYDVYYQVHAQNTGWMSWAKNGQSAGTAGYGYRLEAIQIVFVPKGASAPGDTSTPFIQG